MAPVAAHAAKVEYSATLAGTYTEIDGINKGSIKLNGESLDTTDFKDTSAFRTKIASLRNASGSMSGDYEPADVPEAAIIAAWLAGTNVFIKVLPDGTKGFLGEAVITNIGLDADVGGKAAISIDWEFTGAVSAV